MLPRSGPGVRRHSLQARRMWCRGRMENARHAPIASFYVAKYTHEHPLENICTRELQDTVNTVALVARQPFSIVGRVNIAVERRSTTCIPRCSKDRAMKWLTDVHRGLPAPTDRAMMALKRSLSRQCRAVMSTGKSVSFTPARQGGWIVWQRGGTRIGRGQGEHPGGRDGISDIGKSGAAGGQYQATPPKIRQL